MLLLNVSFGIFALMPQGWLFMIFVIACECAIFSKVLAKSWGNQRIYLAVALANIISGLAGFIGSVQLNGGWYLVVWFPWISSNELDLSNAKARDAMIIYYLAAFILSLIIETIANGLLLRKVYSIKRIIATTIIVNVITYLIGSAILYSYSFGLL